MMCSWNAVELQWSVIVLQTLHAMLWDLMVYVVTLWMVSSSIAAHLYLIHASSQDPVTFLPLRPPVS